MLKIMMSNTRMLATVTTNGRIVMMVTLKARAMTKMGDASIWKGFQLSQTHQARTRMDHTDDGAISDGLRSMKFPNQARTFSSKY